MKYPTSFNANIAFGSADFLSSCRISLIVITLTITGCGGSGGGDTTQPNILIPPTEPEPDPDINPDPDPSTGNVFAPDPSDLVKTPEIYQQDGYGAVDVIRLDVKTETVEGVCTIDDLSGCTLDDVIADINHKDAFKVDIPVHFKSDDFADDGSFTNATLRQRGGTTRLAPQKSFRIKFDNGDEVWRGERSLLLNKHPYESSRLRNKLAFDLMSEIPHLLSFRTQFTNLWLDNGPGAEDYGLFTHIEAPGKRYLKRRNLDEDDRLYKASYFRFSDNALNDLQLDEEGKPINKDLFETFLEIEAGKDHRPLIEMLTALHSPDRSFESVLDEYFNRNNVLTWITVNFLLHQTDAVTHNYILYNPKGTKKFYFLPWDYDGGFVLESEPSASSMTNQDLQRRLYYGYARGINSDFITRFYKLPGIHQDIIAAADILRENYLTDANIAEKADRYAAVINPYTSRLPDSEYNPNYYEFSTRSFPGFVAGNHEALSTRFGIPMPPELKDPYKDGDDWVITWEPAFDVTGSNLTYELLVSRSKGFEPDAIEFELSGIEDSAEPITVRVNDDYVYSGRHYARVIARAASDPNRYWQVAKNTYTHDGETHFGLIEFDVP